MFLIFFDNICLQMTGVFFLIVEFLRTILRFVLNVLFGDSECICCSKSSVRGGICSECMRNLLIVPASAISSAERCSVCGKILLSEEGVCVSCRESPVIKSADFVFPVIPYRLWAKNLLTAWKLGGHRELSSVFAEVFHAAIENSPSMKDSVIVPVPPRPGKIKKAGWDQIDEICKFLRYKYKYKVSGLLERVSCTQQKKLNREGRLSSMGSVYVLSDLCRKLSEMNLLPSSVVLVDDVMTTGATAESCALLLKECGIPKINILTLFMVD